MSYDEVVVIGAGAAGLAAASRLQQGGKKVTVLEARERLGGRMSTVDRFGVPFDAGAQWIHYADSNAWTGVAANLGVATADMPAGTDAVADDGQTSTEEYDAILVEKGRIEELMSASVDQGEDVAAGSASNSLTTNSLNHQASALLGPLDEAVELWGFSCLDWSHYGDGWRGETRWRRAGWGRWPRPTAPSSRTGA